MTDTVERAVIALSMPTAEYEAGGKRVVATNKEVVDSTGRVVETTEKMTRSQVTSAQSVDRLVERLDRNVAAENRRQRQIEMVDRALNDGSIKQTKYAQALAAINARHDEATTSVTGFGSALNKVTSLLGAFGIYLSAAALVGFAKNVVSSVGGLGELAEQLGISTDALQAYRFAAMQSSVGSEQFETTIKKLTQNIGDAAQNSDSAIKAFQNMGIGVLDMSGKVRTTESVLGDIADRIRDAKSEAERAQIAMDTFGKSGFRLIPMLLQGREGLIAWTAAAKEAGVINRAEIIKSFDEASDAIDVFYLRVKAWTANLLFDFGEFFAALGKEVSEIPGEFMTFFTRLTGIGIGINSTLTSVGNALDHLGPAAKQAADSLNPLTESQLRANAAADAYIRSLELERDSVGKTTAEILKMRLERETETKIVSGQIVLTRKYTDAQVEQAVAILASTEKIKDHNKALVDESIAVERVVAEDRSYVIMAAEQRNKRVLLTQDIGRQIERLNEEADAANKIIIEYDAVSESYRLNTRELQILAKMREIESQNILINVDDIRTLAVAYVDAAEARDKAIERQQVALDRIRQQDELLLEPFKNAIRGMQTAFSDFFEQAFSGGIKKFGDLADAIKQMFIKLAAQLAALLVFRPVVGGVLGAVGVSPSVLNALGVGPTASAGVSTASNILSLPSNLISSMVDFFSGAAIPFTTGISVAGAGATAGLAGGAGAFGVAAADAALLSPLLVTGFAAVVAAIGALALSSIFKSKPTSGPTVGAAIGTDLGIIGTGTDNAATQAQADQFAKWYQDSLKVLLDATRATLTSALYFEESANKGTMLRTGDEWLITVANDEQQKILQYIMLNLTTGVDDFLKSRIAVADTSSLEKFVADVQKAVLQEALPQLLQAIAGGMSAGAPFAATATGVSTAFAAYAAMIGDLDEAYRDGAFAADDYQKSVLAANEILARTTGTFTQAMRTFAFEQSDVEGTITRMYQVLLDRAPDAEGLAWWMNTVATGANTLEDVFKEMAMSAEAAAGASGAAIINLTEGMLAQFDPVIKKQLDLAAAGNQYADMLATVNDLYAGGKITVEDFTTATANLSTWLQLAEDSINGVTEAVQILVQLPDVGDVTRQVEDMLAEFDPALAKALQLRDAQETVADLTKTFGDLTTAGTITADESADWIAKLGVWLDAFVASLNQAVEELPPVPDLDETVRGIQGLLAQFDPALFQQLQIGDATTQINIFKTSLETLTAAGQISADEAAVWVGALDGYLVDFVASLQATAAALPDLATVTRTVEDMLSAFDPELAKALQLRDAQQTVDDLSKTFADLTASGAIAADDAAVWVAKLGGWLALFTDSLNETVNALPVFADVTREIQDRMAQLDPELAKTLQISDQTAWVNATVDTLNALTDAGTITADEASVWIGALNQYLGDFIVSLDTTAADAAAIAEQMAQAQRSLADIHVEYLSLTDPLAGEQARQAQLLADRTTGLTADLAANLIVQSEYDQALSEATFIADENVRLFAQSLADAAAAADDSAAQLEELAAQADQVLSTLNSLLLGSLSPLTPDQQIAQANAILGAGNASVTDLNTAIQAAASYYGTASQEYAQFFNTAVQQIAATSPYPIPLVNMPGFVPYYSTDISPPSDLPPGVSIGGDGQIALSQGVTLASPFEEALNNSIVPILNDIFNVENAQLRALAGLGGSSGASARPGFSALQRRIYGPPANAIFRGTWQPRPGTSLNDSLIARR